MIKIKLTINIILKIFTKAIGTLMKINVILHLTFNNGRINVMNGNLIRGMMDFE